MNPIPELAAIDVVTNCRNVCFGDGVIAVVFCVAAC